jgi:hypothetical protein
VPPYFSASAGCVGAGVVGAGSEGVGVEGAGVEGAGVEGAGVEGAGVVGAGSAHPARTIPPSKNITVHKMNNFFIFTSIGVF